MLRPPPGPWRATALVVAAGIGWVACASPPAVPLGPDGKPDPVLAEGRDLYSQHCKSCHGADGGGGRGPSLQRIEEKYPELADQLDIVAEGKGGQMPAFEGRLSADEITAVVRYTREVIAADG